MTIKGEVWQKRLCRLPGCNNVRYARKRCNKHYQRLVIRMRRDPHQESCVCIDCMDMRRDQLLEEAVDAIVARRMAS